MDRKEKMKETIAIVIASLIVHVPMAAGLTVIYVLIVKWLGINMDIALMFLIWFVSFSSSADEKIAEIWRGDERIE